MNDERLCEMFGTTLEEVEADVEKYESGDLSGFDFSKPIDGRPMAKMKTSTVKFYDFELAAIDSAAKREGISRPFLIRRACDSELIDTA